MALWLHKILDLAGIPADIDTIRNELARIFAETGFEFFFYLDLRAHGNFLLSNACSDWQTRYIRDNYAAKDPIVSAARGALRPLSWDARKKGNGLAPDRRRVQQAADIAGLTRGVSLPIRTSFGHLAILTGATGSAMPDAIEDLDPILAASAVSQLHARLKGEQETKHNVMPTSLTVKQALCLRWSAEGKSMRAIAMIEQMPYPNVVFHLNNARHALDAISLAQATAIATKLELI